MTTILIKFVTLFYRVPRYCFRRIWKCIYNFVPYPRTWALFTRARIPCAYINGKESGLNRPESISFSPCGSELAVCNSTGSSVTFYPSLGNGRYGTSHSHSITNTECLNYIHDAIISPCDRSLIAVARDVHTLSLFNKQNKQGRKQNDEPLWMLAGEEAKLNCPTSVAIHPTESCIAVANRKVYGVAIYKKSTETGFFESEPHQCLLEEDLSAFDLAPPHGLDFSSKGDILAVAHKYLPIDLRIQPKGDFLAAAHNLFGISKNPEAKGQSALAVFKYEDGSQLLRTEPMAISLYGTAELHSVSVHPSLNLFAVSIEAQGVDLLYYAKEKGTLELIDSFSVFRIGLSIKGVGFTQDGKQVAITSELNEVLFFNISSSLAKLPELTEV